MVSINYSSREVCCKIVYYGPGLSGKTTNLQYVHSKVPPNTRGKMISLATEADRTLYFDFLPINIGTINGFAAKFQLYTVPGQVYYNATRKLVLRGVDGVVFVADSQPDKMEENIESLMNLEDNLQEYGYDLNELPMVIQYNKRDLPGVLPVAELDQKLNLRGRPTFEASATIGTGVFDTLKLIIKLVLEKAKNNATSRSQKPSVTFNEPAQPAAAEPEPYPTPLLSPTGGMAGPTASTATAVQTPPKEVAPEEPEVKYRPYPGSDKKSATEHRLTVGAFTPSHNESAEETAIGQRAIKSAAEESKLSGVSKRAPSMAPPIKRRIEKKRGFFKRLLGIK